MNENYSTATAKIFLSPTPHLRGCLSTQGSRPPHNNKTVSVFIPQSATYAGQIGATPKLIQFEYTSLHA